MKKAWLLLLILVAVFGFSGSAGAALTVIGTAEYADIDCNLIYMDYGPFGPITWLDFSKSYGLSGAHWEAQVYWASLLGTQLTVKLNPGYTSNFDWTTEWRLPKTVDGPYEWGYSGTTTGGYNITTSELGYLYYEALGNKGSYDTSGNVLNGTLINTGDFASLKGRYYWSGTTYSSDSIYKWHFDLGDGEQTIQGSGQFGYGLAGRPGEVSFVPLPAAVWLLGSGLIGLVGFRKKFKKS